MRIYLDLDGVMADFDAHFLANFKVKSSSVSPNTLWKWIGAVPDFFRDMPMCDGAAYFWQHIKLMNPIILTACSSSNYVEVAKQKRQWVREHLSPDVTVLPVTGGKHKWLFMHAPGDILIDDYQKNLEPWTAAGGVSILHRSFDETRDLLAQALTEGAMA